MDNHMHASMYVVHGMVHDKYGQPHKCLHACLCIDTTGQWNNYVIQSLQFLVRQQLFWVHDNSMRKSTVVRMVVV